MNKRPSVRWNIVANVIGQGWSGLLGIILVPVYIKLLGVESYGLIGLSVTVQAALTILDFGLSGTINREFARASEGTMSAQQMRDLLRTFEWLYWPVALAIAIGSIAVASTLADHWLTPVQLSRQEVATGLALMGVVVAAQWPTSLYGGALTGLQHQGLLNVLLVVFSTLRSAGVIVPLLLIDASITTFFVWQFAISVLQSVAFAAAVWRRLPTAGAPAFSKLELARVWRFAGGLTGMSATSFLMLQLDRLVLASLLDLKAFGYYSTAATLASTLPRVVAPVAKAVYPRYSQLVAGNDTPALRALYHRTNQAVAVLLAVVAAVTFFYSDALLYLWTASREIADAAGTVLTLLMLGGVFGALSNLPYSLQLAYGNTRLSLSLSIAALIVYAPVLWRVAESFGAVGAAWTALVLHLTLLVTGAHLMHRTMLKGEEKVWYLRDLVPPFAAAFTIGLVMHVVWPDIPRSILGVLLFAVIGGLATLGATLAARDVRSSALALGKARLGRVGRQFP